MGLRILGAAILAFDTQAEVLLVDLGPQKAAEHVVLLVKEVEQVDHLFAAPGKVCSWAARGGGLAVLALRGLEEREGLLRILRRSFLCRAAL